MALDPHALRALRPPQPTPAPVPVHPQVLIALTGPGQLHVTHNLVNPGGWTQTVNMLLDALQVARREELAEQAPPHEARRIVVPQGVVVG